MNPRGDGRWDHYPMNDWPQQELESWAQFAYFVFDVTWQTPSLPYVLLSHEAGHLFGMMHDRRALRRLPPWPDLPDKLNYGFCNIERHQTTVMGCASRSTRDYWTVAPVADRSALAACVAG